MADHDTRPGTRPALPGFGEQGDPQAPNERVRDDSGRARGGHVSLAAASRRDYAG